MDTSQIPDYNDPAPDFSQQQLKMSLGNLGLMYDELEFLDEESLHYNDKNKAYNKLLRLFLNFYLSIAREVYDRQWYRIQDALDNNNTQMKRKLALKAFCWAFPRYSNCAGQSSDDIVKETWEEIEDEKQSNEMEIDPTIYSGGKKRKMKTKKHKNHKKGRSHKKHRKGRSKSRRY